VKEKRHHQVVVGYEQNQLKANLAFEEPDKQSHQRD
jgi:hypothetical protein